MIRDIIVDTRDINGDVHSMFLGAYLEHDVNKNDVATTGTV
jgi:hypothetical protein